MSDNYEKNTISRLHIWWCYCVADKYYLWSIYI